MPRITGAGIVLPKPTENNQFYAENLENRLKKSSENKKKHSEIKRGTGENEIPTLKNTKSQFNSYKGSVAGGNVQHCS